MISSELVNVLFSSFAKFVSKLTNREVAFEEIKYGEVMVPTALKIDKFFKDATDAFDNPSVVMIGAFEPGKIYCLQIDSNSVSWEMVEEIFKFLRTKNIDLIVIDRDVKFVSLPDGYEVIKKEEDA